MRNTTLRETSAAKSDSPWSAACIRYVRRYLTPVLIITGACGIASGTEFADVQIALLQNAMLIAGIVTLIQLYAIGRSVEKFQSSWERVQDLSVSAAVLHLLWVVESLDMVRSWVLPLSVGYLNQY